MASLYLNFVSVSHIVKLRFNNYFISKSFHYGSSLLLALSTNSFKQLTSKFQYTKAINAFFKNIY